MTDDQQELEDLKLDLVAHQQRAAYLKTNVGALRNQLKAEEAELTDLIGGHWGGHQSGDINRIKGKIADKEREIVHKTRPKVVWNGKPGYHDDGKIVAKVTAKRIYVCSPGYTSHDLYNKDGTAVSGNSKEVKINIEATFGGPCPEKL